MKLFTISSDNLTSPLPSGAAKDLIEKNNNKTINKPKAETKDISRLEVNDSKIKMKQ